MKQPLHALEEHHIKIIYGHGRSWNNDNFLHNPENAIKYLEDRIAHCTTDIGLICIDREIYLKGHEKGTNHDTALLNSFYTTTLFRYLQITSGQPKDIQHLQIYDTPHGNQVDQFLLEFFNIKPKNHE